MSLKIDRGLVLRNTIINILGGLAPVAISIVTLPRVLSVLGTENYGILSLALVVLGYFSFLELGLGTATTKFVAEALGKGDEEALPSIIWTALLLQLGLGVLGGLLVEALAPVLVGSWLNIPTAMQPEARSALLLLGLAVPMMLVCPTLNGVLEAAQRFDLVNLVAIPASAATSLVMYAGASMGFRLSGIIALLIASRVIITLWLLALCLRLFPALRRSFGVSRTVIKRLVMYGGWFTVSGLVVPLLMYLDRFMLGRYVSLSDVTYFTVPYGMVVRLYILPASLVRTLFPAFSTLDAANRSHLEELYLRSFKYMVLASGPLILFLSTFGGDLMLAWLGPDFSRHGGRVFSLLLYGSIFAMLAPIAATLLQGIGRPDIVVKWYLFCVPANTLVVWLLIRNWGLDGAALSFALRAAAEAVALAFMAAKLAEIKYSALVRHRLWGMIAMLVCLGLLMSATPLASGLSGRFAAYAAGLALFLGMGWFLMLDDTDQEFIKAQLSAKLKPRLGTI